MYCFHVYSNYRKTITLYMNPACAVSFRVAVWQKCGPGARWAVSDRGAQGTCTLTVCTSAIAGENTVNAVVVDLTG